MIKIVRVLVPAVLCLVWGPVLIAPGQDKVIEQQHCISLPVCDQKVISATKEALGITYPEGKRIEVAFQGTERLPGAHGLATVKRKKGITAIDVRFDQLKPAYLFGGDYSTYVLWTVSPQGQVDNVGEVIQSGDNSHMKVTTTLETFGMFVTAEPHYLVSAPSRFVVLETTRPEWPISGHLIQASRINYRALEGIYRFDRESLADVDYVHAEVRPQIREAQAAINVAMLSGANRFAPVELRQANEAMDRLNLAVSSQSDDRSLSALAHEVIRLAVAAQNVAESRTVQIASAAQISQTPRVLPRVEEQEIGRRVDALASVDRVKLNTDLNSVIATRRNAENIVIDLASLFESNTINLLPSGRETLSRIASILLSSTGYSKVVIMGYGAGTVRDYFLQSGMPESVLVVEGTGGARSLALPNRPLEIIIE